MATKRTDGPRPTMIHCEYCGEDYASTYKHCPFCDEIEPDEDYYEDEDEPRPQSGGRVWRRAGAATPAAAATAAGPLC